MEKGLMSVRMRYALINAAASPKEYVSEPHSMFRAIKDMRAHNFEILAIYHSHPTTAPIPSRIDLERNFSPDVANFIISLQGPEPMMRGWWLSEDRYDEATWEIQEP